VNVARAFRCKREKHILRVIMVFGIVRVFFTASNLRCLGVDSLVGGAWRGKNKVTKERTVGRVKERNQNIRAFARSNEGRTDAVGNLSFTNNRSRRFQRIPVVNVSGSFRYLVGHEQSNIVGRMVTENIMKRAIKAVAKCIVKQVSGVNLDARSIMKAKRVNKFTTFAIGRRKKWHHCVESKGIWKHRLVASMKVTSRDGRGIEGETHVGKAGADELCINRWVVRKRRAIKEFMIIKLLSKGVLKFEAKCGSSKEPKGRGVLQSLAESRDRVTYVACNRCR
jgi:hypothetical protein